jgi:nitrate reductase beta subunit
MLAAMRSYMRAINLGDEPDESIAAAVGMTGAQVQSLYRLLAIAKYEDRYVIPPAHREVAAALDELPGCSLDYSLAGVGASATGEAAPIPVSIETFHATKQRLEAEKHADLTEGPR